MPTPNIPDEVPDEVMDVLLNVFNSGGHVSQYHAMRAAFVAALPLLLEQKGWEYRHRDWATNQWFRASRSATRQMDAYKQCGYEFRPLYRLKVSNEQ